MMKRPLPLLTYGLLLTSLVMTGISLYGKKTVYSAYASSQQTMPSVSYALSGIRDGISPLDALKAPRDTAPAEKEDDKAVAHGLSDFRNLYPSGLTDAVREKDDGADSDALRTESAAEEALPPTEETAVDESGHVAEGLREEGNDLQGHAPHLASGTPQDDTYYADALFIGDSRTVGLSQYCPALDEYATFYCQVSLTIYSVLDAEIAQTQDGLISVEEALKTQSFGKIYLMVGINEIGGSAEDFFARYASVVDRIRQLQPDAHIYIQSIMHVSARKEIEAPAFSNVYVNERNALLATLANDTDIFYIDINYLIDDENGALDASYTFDGVHLTAGAYDLWYQAIRAQTR